MSQIYLGTLSLFNAILNGNRATRAPAPGIDADKPAGALKEIADGTDRFLGTEPGALMAIMVTPQAADAVHAKFVSRLLPVQTGTFTSGGWLGWYGSQLWQQPLWGPPPIVLPPAIWKASAGTMVLQGLGNLGSQGAPLPGFGYPGVFAQNYG